MNRNGNLDAADSLEFAADKFESGEWKWIQAAYSRVVNDKFNACYIGGIRKAAYILFPHNDWFVGCDAEEASINYLTEHCQMDSNVTCVEGWNDRQGRTMDEVVETMKQVAKDLRNQL